MSEITPGTIKTRIKMKYLTPEDQANTTKTGATLLQGELAVYGGEKPKMKVGDGETILSELPFIGSDGDITVDLGDNTSEYVKPVTPLKKEQSFIYPITTYDQIILENGNRWNGVTLQAEDVEILIQEKVITTTYSRTLDKDNWSGNNAPYTQEINIENITEADDPIVDIDLSEAAVGNIANLKKNWAYVDRVTTSTGKITFYCYTNRPIIDLPVNLKIISNMIDGDLEYAEGVSF